MATTLYPYLHVPDENYPSPLQITGPLLQNFENLQFSMFFLGGQYIKCHEVRTHGKKHPDRNFT